MMGHAHLSTTRRRQRPSTPTRSSTATARSSPAAAPCAHRRNIVFRRTRNGPSSPATSSAAGSPSETAAAPTTPPASTSTSRCPLLRPDPAQRSRLAQICSNLADRIAEAESAPLARRSRGPENQPRRRPGQARPGGPDHRAPRHHHQPRHASLHRRCRPHSHRPGKPPASTRFFMIIS